MTKALYLLGTFLLCFNFLYCVQPGKLTKEHLNRLNNNKFDRLDRELDSSAISRTNSETSASNSYNSSDVISTRSSLEDSEVDDIQDQEQPTTLQQPTNSNTPEVSVVPVAQLDPNQTTSGSVGSPQPDLAETEKSETKKDSAEKEEEPKPAEKPVEVKASKKSKANPPLIVSIAAVVIAVVKDLTFYKTDGIFKTKIINHDLIKDLSNLEIYLIKIINTFNAETKYVRLLFFKPLLY